MQHPIVPFAGYENNFLCLRNKKQRHFAETFSVKVPLLPLFYS